MKKRISFLLCVAILFSNFICFSTVKAEEYNGTYKVFFVAESGDDNNDGSESRPFRTIERAQAEVRKYNKEMTGDIIVNIDYGTYTLEEALDFTNEDSGYNGHRVIYRGDKNKRPVISGGVKVDNFKESSEYPGLFEAYLPQFDKQILQFYVNGEKRTLAKLEHYITPKGSFKEDGSPYTADGMYVKK